jgi:choline dehydrogenase-like flavoprotein
MTVTLHTPSKRRSSARAARAAALAIAAATTTVAGVFIAGGVVTNDFRAAMALTALWFVTAAASACTSLKAGRSIGIPIIAGYLIATATTGGYLAATTLRDKTIDETVVTGTPTSAPTDARVEGPANIEETRGAFRSAEHATRGTARIIKLAGGGRILLGKLKDLLGPMQCHATVIPRWSVLDQQIPLAGIAHNCGTVRFGTDPAESVLDPNCKAHDLDNLYVVDTSFFPSSSAVNPALTAMANALRVGDHLIERLGAATTNGTRELQLQEA